MTVYHKSMQWCWRLVDIANRHQTDVPRWPHNICHQSDTSQAISNRTYSMNIQFTKIHIRRKVYTVKRTAYRYLNDKLGSIFIGIKCGVYYIISVCTAHHESRCPSNWNWRCSSKSKCYESSNFTLHLSRRLAGTVIHNCDILLINIVSLLHALLLALRFVSNQIDTQTYILLTTIRNNACTNNSKVVESYQKGKPLK